ncbi:MAG: glycine dehydrogenase, partial [Solirubrobacterales bacterium]
MAGYTPLTDGDRQRMLELLGLGSEEELLETIPEELRLDRPLAMDDGLPEAEVFERLAGLAGANRPPDSEPSFLGAGMYDHYVPAIVDAITSR